MLYLTWLDLNSWLIELDQVRILVDPWLVGPMTLGLPAWLLRFERTQTRSCPEPLDMILLSQGLPDHAHAASLETLDRQIPLVCPPSAADLVQRLGFQQITVLKPGETFYLKDQLTFQATLGAPLGPLRQENGYILRSRSSGQSLYYEPHGFPDPKLANQAPVDVVITPIIDVTLPLIGPIIAGLTHGLELAQSLTPQVIIPTAQPGNVTIAGILPHLLQAPTQPETLAERLPTLEHPPQILQLEPWERTAIALATPEPLVV